MKNLIVSLACCGMLSLATFAPVVTFAQSSSTQTMKDKDGTVKMVSGKMMVMQNGKWTAMTSDMTATNGTKVKTDGTVTMKSGKTQTLKNGQCVKPDGTIK